MKPSFSRLTASQSRAAALTILGLLILFAGVAVAGPLVWLHKRYDKALAEYGDQLARYQRLVMSKPMVEARLAEVKAREPRKLYLKAVTPGLAASEMQEVARTVIEANGGRLATVQIPAHKDDGRFRQISVSVQMSASAPALRRILHALESGTPYLYVDNFTARQTVGYGYKQMPGVEPEMFVQFDLTGFSLLGT